MYKFSKGDIVRVVSYPPGRKSNIQIGQLVTIGARSIGQWYDVKNKTIYITDTYYIEEDDWPMPWNEENFELADPAADVETVTDLEFDELLQE